MNPAEADLPPGYRVTRFYTVARRFPTLIGRMPNGGALPFGPYTVGQFLTLIVLLVGGFRTMPVWGGERGVLVNGVLLIGVCAFTVILMRKVPWRGRGPMPLLRGALFGYSRTAGTYRGKPMPVRASAAVLPAVVVAGEDVMRRAYALAGAQQLRQQQLQHQNVDGIASVDVVAGAHGAVPTTAAAGARSEIRAIGGSRTTSASDPAGPRLVTRPTRPSQHAQPGQLTQPARGPRPASTVTAVGTSRPLSGLQRLRQQAELADAGH